MPSKLQFLKEFATKITQLVLVFCVYCLFTFGAIWTPFYRVLSVQLVVKKATNISLKMLKITITEPLDFNKFRGGWPRSLRSPQVKLRSAVPGLAYEFLEFVHALCMYIELWMHAGSLESTKDA